MNKATTRRRGVSAVFLWGFLQLLTSTVAPESTHAFERRSWFAATGLLSNHAMSDVNSGLQDLGQSLVGGQFVSDVPVGLGFGFGIGTDVTRRVAVGMHYHRFAARTSGDASNSDLQTGRVELAISLPANSVSAAIEVRHHGGRGVDIPAEGSWSIGAGGSGGVIWMSGDLRITSDRDGINTTTLSGSGPLFEGFLAADIWQNPRLGFGTSLGYRYARIDSPEMSHSGTVPADTPIQSIDYSGIYVQVAIKFALR